MHLDQNPFFRKPISPWYDSAPACWGMIIVMTLVFCFAVAGMVVGSARAEFSAHVWFPCALAFLSLFLVVKTGLRLRRRSRNH